MPRTCTICTHPERPGIDQALAAGAPVRAIASRYVTISHMAVQRHKEEHLPKALTKAQETTQVEQAIDILKQLKAINAASVAILHEARSSADPHTALKAVDRIQRQIELQAKLLGELDERPQVNVLLAPEWVSIRAALLIALGPYPEARAAVAQQLLTLEGTGGPAHGAGR